MGHYLVCVTYTTTYTKTDFCIKEILRQNQLTWDVVLFLGCYGNTCKKTENTAAMKAQINMKPAQIQI